MLWLILALIASEVAMLLIGPRVLPVLRKLKFGQTIYELGPKSHRTKQGTPTMGGLMFAAVTCVVTLLIMSAVPGIKGHDEQRDHARDRRGHQPAHRGRALLGAVPLATQPIDGLSELVLARHRQDT